MKKTVFNGCATALVTPMNNDGSVNYDVLKKIINNQIEGNIDERQIEYNSCIEIINKLRFNEESTLFAVERDKGLESIIGNIYQSFARTRYL